MVKPRPLIIETHSHMDLLPQTYNQVVGLLSQYNGNFKSLVWHITYFLSDLIEDPNIFS